MSDQRISVTERAVKSVLRKSNIPETWFGARFSAAPYMACEHGCLYCDGRAEKYWVEGQFDHDIVVRSNFTEVFSREVGALREQATVSFGSGITDPYQPVEAEYGIMRDAAEVLEKHNIPGAVLTKSALIKRDLDIWSRVAANTGMNLLMSITTVDDSIRAIFEPKASSMDARFSTLSSFKQAGCGIAILAMPFLPGISDSDDSIIALAKRAQAVGADFVLPGSLTLRPGRQKDTYMNIIENNFRHLLPLYHDLYREQRQSGSPLQSYQDDLYSRITVIMEQYELLPRAPHHLYRRMFPLYDEIYMLMDHMVLLFERRHGDTSVERLKKAVTRYREWLTARKKAFNRKRSMTQDDLEAEIILAAQSGVLAEILQNDRLCSFIEEVLIDRKIFDYHTLKFEDG